MDDLDRASALEMKTTQMVIDHHQKTNKPTFIVSAKRCVECDAVIPSARQLAVLGCQLCVYCQSMSERGR